ncbi:hypothetical protein QA612_12925 [Evansella sp. AB-P1]|uniref:hypothetical protein n=1 Tax=Evansella sp. AB-P1 TaxID=3037653 RepID=UPI00241E3C7B|nr:hypothetical protein [Evansella sp. AB-P1]MDG5788385.1 hypothetical protein [Evansella sp. AB-P1]
MPLNVTYEEQHIGFVAGAYPGKSHVFLIALTSLTVEEAGIDQPQMKSYLARIFEATNFFGRVKEDELNEILKRLQKDNFKDLDIHDDETLLRFIFLKAAAERGGYEIEMLFNWEELSHNVEGFLILDMEKVLFKRNAVILEEKISYFSDATLAEDNGLPIFAIINDYPIIKTDVMGAGEGLLLGANLSDFGGRNHSHKTTLLLKSGNSEQEFTFPLHMHVKRGMPIQLYVKENRIHKIFCNETIYQL